MRVSCELDSRSQIYVLRCCLSTPFVGCRRRRRGGRRGESVSESAASLIVGPRSAYGAASRALLRLVGSLGTGSAEAEGGAAAAARRSLRLVVDRAASAAMIAAAALVALCILGSMMISMKNDRRTWRGRNWTLCDCEQ